MKIPANGFTHAGKFHADDVFATALLQILRPDIKITRGFTVPDDFDGIVYDIGFGMFDHHQEPREYRANGVPYAAFGLLWRVLGPGLVGERQARLIDENFIQPLGHASMNRWMAFETMRSSRRNASVIMRAAKA